jgi:REP element-mobilizing transposase RayT
MKYDPEIHHRRSIRLKSFDYSLDGAYFVTLCAQERKCLFGEMSDGLMLLNEAGRMVEHWWRELPEQFQHISLDEYMVMPNHFHGIIVIHNVDCRGDTLCSPAFGCSPAFDRIQNQGDHKDRPYGTMENSLGRIIQSFKSITTNAYIRGVKENNWPPFPGRLWQRNYYERIIRDDGELTATREYIATNPHQWANDGENPDYVRSSA